jgi:NADH-quinone oxidoreductase subunit A
MLQEYFPLLVLLAIVVAFLGVSLVLSEVFGKRRATRGKAVTYECGMTPTGTARGRFSVKFYVVAVLFILFDIGSAFLIPWAVTLKELAAAQPGNGAFLLGEMVVFVGILLLGLAYVWRKGALEWDR